MTQPTHAMHLLHGVRKRTVEQRREAGRAARDQRPRSSLAAFAPAADRPDPVTTLLAQDTVRAQLLLPLRHSRMAVSPFTFYRGSAAVMAYDLGSAPNTGLIAQLCGDAHLSNFGLFGSPDRSVLFDINDFDETHPGPFEWDVMRLATSFILAARDNRLSASVGRKAAQAAAREYRQQMATFADSTDLDTWYSRIDASTLSAWAMEYNKRDGAKAVDKGVSLARERTGWTAIAKMTEVVDGHRRFLNQPPLLMPLEMDGEVARGVIRLLDSYRDTLPRDRQLLLHRYHAIDVAHKVVGVGSVGLLAFVILLEGRDPDDLLVLQAKQAVPSVLEPFTGPSELPLPSARVVAGQQLMQAASDVFLGYVSQPAKRSYYVRQLRDMKFAPDPSTLTASNLPGYAMFCGRTLARAHARAGDAVAIDSYLGTGTKFDEAIEEFSEAYADQVEVDFAAFTAAIADGRVSVDFSGNVDDYRLVVTPEGTIEIINAPGSPV